MSECEWCGSSKHKSDVCPTRNLIRYLNDEPLPSNAQLPDLVTVMSENEVINKTEEEWKQELNALHHIRKRS
jgi:hypothetical protein